MLYVAVSCMHDIIMLIKNMHERVLVDVSIYNSSNFTKDYIFCFNKNNMIHAWWNYIVWLCSDATYNIEVIYNTVQQKFKNSTLHISPPSSVGSALGLKFKGRWFEPRVYHYFSSRNVRLLASRSLQVKTNRHFDWSVTNQIEYTGLREDSYL